MTIIAVSGKQMAADSWTFDNHIGYPLIESKIARAADGSLVGAAGMAVDCSILRKWVLAGMDFEKPPALTANPTEDDTLGWLWLRPGGRVFLVDHLFCPQEIESPCGIGLNAAVYMVMGALLHNVPLLPAMEAAVKRVPFTGGEIRIETVR